MYIDHITWYYDIYILYKVGETYDTHPYEIQARNAEENWKEYYKKEFDEWMSSLIERNGTTEY